jgi:hypothetical protein
MEIVAPVGLCVGDATGVALRTRRGQVDLTAASV